MKYETRNLTLFWNHSILERCYKISGLELEGLQHLIRREGDVLIPRSTVYLMLHFMELMNQSSYEIVVGHVGMCPAVQDNQLFDRRNGGCFSLREVSVVFDRWSAQAQNRTALETVEST